MLLRVAVVTVLSATGCGAAGPDPDAGAGDAAANDADAVPGDTGADDNAPADPGGYDPGEHELCYDFVCTFDFDCIDEHSYYGMTSEPDDDPECPDPCVPDGPFECPEKTWCYDRADAGAHWRYSPCMPISCNPSTGLACDEQHYCDTLPGDCNGPGICASRDEFEHMGGPADDVTVLDPECGCDGVTYPGWVARARAAVGMMHAGPCCDPAGLNFTAINPDHFEVFVVCADGDLSKSAPDNIKKVLSAATFGTQGAWAGCAEGESAYVGRLSLTDTGTVDPAQYQALCELDSFVGVGGVTGHPAGYCESLPCYDLRLCTEIACPSPCGCCDCEFDKVRCTDERRTIRCVSTGCWMNSVECTGYDVCFDDETGSGCRASCEIMRAYLQVFAQKALPCDSPEDCKVMQGFCDPADGPCWLPYNGVDHWSQTVVDDFQSDWIESGCFAGESCGCGARPVADCLAGLCKVVYDEPQADE